MRIGEKLLNALSIFLEHVKTWNLTLTTHSRSCFFEVLIVQCQNSIKYILLRSLLAAMFTWPCKTNFTTVPDPLKLQILLEDQTATELLFQSYAATTTIAWPDWLAYHITSEDMFKRQDITATVQVGTILRTVTRSKKQEIKENLFDVLFDAVTLHHNIAMRGGYLWIFFQRGLCLWFLDNLYYYYYYFLFSFSCFSSK